MLNSTTSLTPGKMSVADKINAAAKKPKKPISKFQVRMGTVAICNFAVGGDAQAGCLFHALLELWIGTKRKIERPYEGGMRGYLFLSLSDLEELTGMSGRTIRERAIPRLRERGFFDIGTGRVTRNGVNKYQIHFDEAAFWKEIIALAEPMTEVVIEDHGHTIVSEKIDRAKLPHLFQRLYDRQIGDE